MNLQDTDTPVKAPDFQEETLDDELMLYSEQRTEAVYLNHTASIVWWCCDGENSIGDIIQMIHGEYPDRAITLIRQDVTTALGAMLDKQVISLA